MNDVPGAFEGVFMDRDAQLAQIRAERKRGDYIKYLRNLAARHERGHRSSFHIHSVADELSGRWLVDEALYRTLPPELRAEMARVAEDFELDLPGDAENVCRVLRQAADYIEGQAKA